MKLFHKVQLVLCQQCKLDKKDVMIVRKFERSGKDKFMQANNWGKHGCWTWLTTHSSFKLVTSGGKLAKGMVVANYAFANLFVQSVWPAVLYIVFSWHADMWPSSTTYFSICNVISQMTTFSSWKTLRGATGRFIHSCYLMPTVRTDLQMPTSPAEVDLSSTTVLVQCCYRCSHTAWKKFKRSSVPFRFLVVAMFTSWAHPCTSKWVDLELHLSDLIAPLYLHWLCLHIPSSTGADELKFVLLTVFVEMRRVCCRDAALSSQTFSHLQFVSLVPCIMKCLKARGDWAHSHAKHRHLWSK